MEKDTVCQPYVVKTVLVEDKKIGYTLKKYNRFCDLQKEKKNQDERFTEFNDILQSASAGKHV